MKEFNWNENRACKPRHPVYRSRVIYVLVHFLRLRPTDSFSDSLPFETGRYTYIHCTVLLQTACSALRPAFAPSFSFVPARSFQSSIGEKYIFVHRTKPLSSTPFPRLILFCPLARTHTFSQSLLPHSDLRSATKLDFRERTPERTHTSACWVGRDA